MHCLSPLVPQMHKLNPTLFDENTYQVEPETHRKSKRTTNKLLQVGVISKLNSFS